jgi:ketosteroid isomerase-like protein
VTIYPVEQLGVPDPAAVADKIAIIELIGLERLWRDTGEWDKVAAAYTDDAVIKTSWFEGSPAAFAERSKEMADRGRHGKHPIVPVYVLINGDRALVESRSEIQNRIPVDGVLVDMVQFVRFISRVRRTAAGWRLVSFEGIYEKGTITAAHPGDSVPLSWADVERVSSRPSYQLHAWGMSLRGYTIPDDLLGDDRPEALRDFYATQLQWLNAHPTT